MNADRYINPVLCPQVIPYAGAVGDNFILMDDNATPHRARVTNQYLQDECVTRLFWPFKSPDLNPIEHPWAHLKYRIDKRIKPTTTLDGLQSTFRREWNASDQNRIRRLINSMRRSIMVVIHAEGGHTRY